MKLLRIAALSLAALIVLLAGFAALFLHNQQRIVSFILRNIRERTGVEIYVDSSRLAFRSHLLVVLEHPVIRTEQHEIVRMEEMRAALNYNAIIFHLGLPLYSITFVSPVVTLPPGEAANAGSNVPQLNIESLGQTMELLYRIRVLTRVVEADEMQIVDSSGNPIAAQIKFLAYTTRRARHLWNVDVDGQILADGHLKGGHLAAHILAGTGGRLPEHVLVDGTLRLWDLPTGPLTAGGFSLSAAPRCRLNFTLMDSAVLSGDAEVLVRNVVLAGQSLTNPITLGDFSIATAFTTSAGQIEFANASVKSGGQTIAEGKASVDRPYQANPALNVSVGEMQFLWRDLVEHLRKLRGLPSDVRSFVDNMRSGKLEIDTVSLRTSLDSLKSIDFATLAQKIVVSAHLGEIAFNPPTESQLPAVQGLGADLTYAGGKLNLTQGSARLGKSLISDVHASFDAGKNFDTIRYDGAAAAQLDAAELQPALLNAIAKAGIPDGHRLEKIAGRIDIDASAKGEIVAGNVQPPKTYEIIVEPHRASVEVQGGPGPIYLVSGEAEIDQREIRLRRLMASAEKGDVVLDGNLVSVPQGVALRRVTVDVHSMPVERWLGFVVDPTDFTAQGKVGGRIVLTGAEKDSVRAEGKLTLVTGSIQLGFLRAPMIVQAATVTMHRQELVLNIPSSRLEGQPLDFKITIPDINHPAVRIDANATRLDVEVMKFIRMPWAPPTKPIKIEIPVYGHVDAFSAKLAKLEMNKVGTDFSYNHGDWRVYNMRGKTLDGSMELEMVGRDKDDWIGIKARTTDLNMSNIMQMAGADPASITGRLDVTADLWADTNNDFFPTIAGTVSIRAVRGQLKKFTMLSRILAMIDLKSWLTAKIPDPRVNGIPFDTIVSNFVGSDGIFYTDDFRLRGSVMDIVARGHLNMNTSSVDMTVGMLPFDTINWLLSSVPLIGNNLSGGAGSILAGYAKVDGPITDPKVRPAPLTSVTELVKKTLGLPINLIAPNTIK